MPGWNFADVWETIADALPSGIAQIHGDRVLTWSAMDRRADGLARMLLDRGAQRQDKVAQYLYNTPEYIESVFATFKAGLVPVNTNYRYTEDELIYLWDNADVVAVVFHGSFTERCGRVRFALPNVRTWVWVDDGSEPCPDWAIEYESATGSASERTVAPWGRTGDDLILLYTGGTTGLPKGVMWRQDDVFCSLNAHSGRRYGDPADLRNVAALATTPGRCFTPAAPLMHGTGLFLSLGTLAACGSMVLLASRSFDPAELLDTIERRRVDTIAWVGDVFAHPVVRLLDDTPSRWDLSSVQLIISAGAMWSHDIKQGLVRHLPQVRLQDALSSSEAFGLGHASSDANTNAATARFTPGPNVRVLTDDGRDVRPGSGERGRLAVGGRLPIGYYKDSEKTAATFVSLDGERYSVPGDYAELADDGTLILLGRGSQCINTGGEKVFPEEVEEVLKLHGGVEDAAVVGMPDELYGQAIIAVVLPSGTITLNEADLVNHVKARLAGFKAPKRIVVVRTGLRGPNGKIDYRSIVRTAADALGVTT